MAERRRERFFRICNELKAAGAPDSAIRSICEYAETITYCGECGHERTAHGNGIVDRRCFVAACGCSDFQVEAVGELERAESAPPKGDSK